VPLSLPARAADVRKERLKSDAEAQTLEDVACLVFLAHYLDDFMAKTDPDKHRASPGSAETAKPTKLKFTVGAGGVQPRQAGRDGGEDRWVELQLTSDGIFCASTIGQGIVPGCLRCLASVPTSSGPMPPEDRQCGTHPAT
jgi:Domain of unknown function (DUF4202)